MKRAVLFTLMTAVILPFAARAQAQGKPDFSGAWTLDAAKSDAPMGRGGRGGPAGPVTLAIKQTAAELTIETKRGEQSQTAIYELDGSESKNEVAGRGGPSMVISKAHWDGAKLVIDGSREVQGFAITTKEVRSLSADGKEMTVETAISTPQGDINQKQVFTKS
jgi:hypothetical protein